MSVLNPLTLARLRSGMDVGYALNFAASLSTRPNRHGYYKVVHEGGTEIYMDGILIVAVTDCPTCEGNGEVQFNTRHGDPEYDDYGACGRCENGMVIA